MTEQTPTKILVVDDLANVRSVLSRVLGREGYAVLEAADGESALEVVRQQEPDAVLLDMKMPGMDGMEALERMLALDPDLPIIMITAYSDVQSAVEAMRLGAYYYLAKPSQNRDIVAIVNRAAEKRRLTKELHALRLRLRNELSLPELMGNSAPMEKICEQISRVAKTNFTVVIYGETGVGKELVAREIHQQSDRRHKPFVPIDCGSIHENLIESELFGHEKGAFTGAENLKPGSFELATGGTLLLDEIENLPLNMQVKLLRALQERQIRRVGGTEPIDVDIRVIATSNLRLEDRVKESKFRRDLYFRLSEFVIEVPPLRERTEDIIFLTKRFIDLTSAELHKPVHGISRPALDRLLTHEWPGNVRELRNVIRRAVLLCDGSLEPSHLEITSAPGLARAEAARPAETAPPALEPGRSLTELVKAKAQNIEKHLIEEALRATGGNKSKAAKLLQVDYKTLHTKAKKYGL